MNRPFCCLSFILLVACQGSAPILPEPGAARRPEERSELRSKVAADPAPRVVARVNGVAIPRSALDEQLARKARDPAALPQETLFRFEREALDMLITQELIRQAVAKEGILISQAELDAGYEAAVASHGGREQFEVYLKHGSLTREHIVARGWERRALELLVEKRLPPITEAELREFYQANLWQFREKEGVRASHILIPLGESASSEEQAEASKRVELVRARLAAGEPFERLVVELGYGGSEGDLGFFPRGKMAPEFEDAAFDTKVGEVRGPVRTHLGFHFIKVTERRENRVVPFEEARPKITASLSGRRVSEHRGALLDELRAAAQIELVSSELTPDPRETEDEPYPTEDQGEPLDDSERP